MRFKNVVALGATAALAGSMAVPAAAVEPLLPNDTYDGRVVIDESVLPTTYSFNLTYASDNSEDAALVTFAQAVAPSCADVAGPASAWFEFTPSTDGHLLLQGQAEYGAELIVAAGTLSDLSSLVFCGPVSGTLAQVSAGTTYTILVMEYVGDPWWVHLSASYFPGASLDIAVAARNGLDPKTGVAVIRGTYTCEHGYWLQISVELAQAKGKARSTPSGVGGFGAAEPVCDGADHPWSAIVAPSTGVFKSGSATVTVSARVEDGVGMEATETVTDQAIALRPAKSLR